MMVQDFMHSWIFQIVWFYFFIFGSSKEIIVGGEYITKSYFDSHDRLTDSEFEDFVKHKLHIGSCQLPQDNPFVAALVDLDRSLVGEGSHRCLSSRFRLDFGSSCIQQLSSCSCEVIVAERLPSGVFADPFELHHLVQRGVFSDAVVFGDTNLELPSFRSNRSVVEVHKKIEPRAIDKSELTININLPLHTRYQPLGHGFSNVMFGLPDLFIQCSSCKADELDHSCMISTDQNSKLEANTIVWEVPTGIKEHAIVVSAVTFISAVVSAFFIVNASLSYSKR